MSTRTIHYSWNDIVTTVGMDEAGSGPSVVLLPALSSISTRAEMRPLFETLAPDFRVSTVDWPGFGDLVRLRTDWSPTILSGFLDWFLSEIVAPPGSRSRRLLCLVSSRSSARHDRTARSHRADMARPFTDGDGRSTPVVRPHSHRRRSLGHRPAALPAKHEPVRRHQNGAGACLRGSRLAQRRPLEREAGSNPHPWRAAWVCSLYQRSLGPD